MEEDPTEPSDWKFLPLREIDSLLRCPICKEYFNNTTIVPQCSHNFCSLCIRRALHSKHQCPLCSKVVNESDLRVNRQLDLLVHRFKANRQNFLDLLTTKTTPPVTTQAACDEYRVPPPPSMSQLPEFEGDSLLPSLTDEPGHHFSIAESHGQGSVSPNAGQPGCSSKGSSLGRNEHHQSLSSNRKNIEQPSFVAKATTVSQAAQSVTVVPSTESVSSSGSLSQSTTGKVPCPVCSQQVPAKFINSHLDTCLTRNSGPAHQPHPLGSSPTHQAHSFSSRPSKAIQKLPNLVFSVMKDRDLREKVKQYGMPGKGPRAVLIERLKEFTLRYNAQCDSNPKTMKEIASEVERIEKSKAAANKSFSGTSQTTRRKSTADPVKMEQQNEAYVKAHADQFDRLTAQARQSKDKVISSKSFTSTRVIDNKDTATNYSVSIQSNQSTPPLSPLATTKTTPRIDRSVLNTNAPTHNVQSGHVSNLRPESPSAVNILNTPKTYKAYTPVNHKIIRLDSCRHKLPLAIELLNTSTDGQLISPLNSASTPLLSSVKPLLGQSTPGVSNRTQPRKLTDNSGYFDNLSPLEELESLNFDPCDEEQRSNQSTPELDMKGQEILAPNSPSHVTEVAPLIGRPEIMTVPESPAALKSLSSHSKRKHNKIKYTSLQLDDSDLDFDIASPKSRKKQRRE